MSTVTQMATLTHGYTMARVDRLAHEAALKASYRLGAMDFTEAREEAWEAIVELLYLLPEKPAEWSLVEAGTRAIGNRFYAEMRDQGKRPNRHGLGGFEETPRFNAYWVHIVGAKPDWTDGVIERMALPRVLSVLTPNEYEAVVALAAHGSMDKAAGALNVTYSAMKQRVRAARRRMLEVWFEGETPPRGTPTADLNVRCRVGHSRTEYGFRTADGLWDCRLCQRRRSRRAWHSRDEVLPVDDEPEAVPGPLTFAPPPDTGPPVGERHRTPDGDVLGSNACWCGLSAGHDWPHKGEGAPHPRLAVAV